MYHYHNRDISWLSFNYRVLQEAMDKSLPLYERLKFLAIYSSNLEEFYRVRLSYYRDLIRNLPPGHEKYLRVQPEAIVKEINAIVSSHQSEFAKNFREEIVPGLAKHNIFIVTDFAELSQAQINYASEYFTARVLCNLQPVILHNNRVRPFLKSGHLYISMRMQVRPGGRYIYGIMKLPVENQLSRFVELPAEEGKHCMLFLEDLAMHFISKVIPGYIIKNWHIIKLTRDEDIELDDFEGAELIRTITDISAHRQTGEPNRFQYDSSIPVAMLKYLCEALEIEQEDLVAAGRHQNFRDFFGFPNPISPMLEGPKHVPLPMPALESCPDIFEAISEKEHLLHFPYQSYSAFIRFLQQAADSPWVTEIKATQYRVASNSAVIDALVKAAANGKAVTVFVELKARFDEETNLRYAQEMKSAGVNVIFSIAGVKVHSKVALVTLNKEGKQSKFCFLGTGNFNEKTARLYADHGLFTADPDFATDLEQLFDYLKCQCHVKSLKFNKLLVSSQGMVEKYTQLIHDEINNAASGRKAYMLIKLNGLEDPAMIDMLYKASEAGVKIDILVRGICCLKTGQPYSKNIRAIRIVDSFLEHARVFYFYAGGKNITYLGSADWMRRNLYKRIECAFPITDKAQVQELLDIYSLQLRDNVKASLIDEKLENIRITSGGPQVRSQEAIASYLKEKTNSQ
jgi:polyphosphate kinase